MVNEKQKSTAQNIIAEIELFMKEESRQREIERQQKAKHTNQGDLYRAQLQHLERYVDQLIQDQTLRTKKVMMKEMKVDLNEKSELYEQLTDRLRNLEQECSNLIQEKKELTDSIETQKTIQKEMNQKIAQAEEGSVKNRSRTQGLLRITS